MVASKKAIGALKIGQIKRRPLRILDDPSRDFADTGVNRHQNGISSSRSPRLPPPAIAGWRAAGREEPKSLELSLPNSLAPPPPPARSSMVSAELNPCSTTSVEYFSTPC